MVNLEISVREIESFWPSVDKLFGDAKENKPFAHKAIRLRYALTAQALATIWRDYMDARRALNREFAAELPDGNTHVPLRNQPAFETSLNALKDVVHSIPFPDRRISKEELDKLDLNIWDVGLLANYFIEPEALQ